MVDLDQRVERWITEHRLDWLDPLVVGITYAGSFGALWMVLGVGVAVYLRRPVLAVVTPLVVLLADLSASGLKHAVDRERPEAALEGIDPLVETPSSPAFPSGHAATSFAAAVVLAAALPSLAPALLVLAGVVAFSRLYVGVHYPLDVLAGALLGAALAGGLGGTVLVARALRASRRKDAGSPRTD